MEAWRFFKELEGMWFKNAFKIGLSMELSDADLSLAQSVRPLMIFWSTNLLKILSDNAHTLPLKGSNQAR